MRHDLFEQSLKEKVIKQVISQTKETAPSYGIVLEYEHYSNTAIVLLSDPETDRQGEILKDVKCPVQLGVQSVYPEPGRPCWVNFKGGNKNFPVITHYFNHKFERFDWSRQNIAKVGIPRYLMVM